MKNGKCRLCGEDKLLNFEHVPPRCSFNKRTRYIETSFQDYMGGKDPLNQKPKGKRNQGGVGYYAYCQTCNNFLGNEYVRYYKEWAEIGALVLSKGKHDGYIYDVFKQNPNRILKQVISMFIAMNQDWFAEEYHELVKFIKTTDSCILPDKFKIYMYLNNGPSIRYAQFSVNGNIKTAEIISCTEIAFPPYGFVLTIGSNSRPHKYLTEITHFKNYDPDGEFNLSLKIAKLETHLSIALDYRLKNEIQKGIDEGNEILRQLSIKNREGD